MSHVYFLCLFDKFICFTHVFNCDAAVSGFKPSQAMSVERLTPSPISPVMAAVPLPQ